MGKQNTFGSKERLKKRKLIEELFKVGESFSIYPLRVYYLLDKAGEPEKNERPEQENDVSIKLGVGVSKRQFKKAVHRNRIKRLMREAYRLQKHGLSAAIQKSPGRNLSVFMIYTGKELPDHLLVKQKVGEVLDKLTKKFIAN